MGVQASFGTSALVDAIPHPDYGLGKRDLTLDGSTLFNKLKNWRRVATRYDKTKSSYLGFVSLASIKLWLPFVHEA